MFNTWNMCWIKLAWWCAYQNLQMVSFLFRTSMSFISWSGLCSIFFLYFNKVYWRTSRCKSKSHYTLKILYYLIPHFFFSIVNHVRQYYYSQEVDMFWAYIVVMSFEGPILICRALLTQDISYCMPNSIKLKKKKREKSTHPDASDSLVWTSIWFILNIFVYVSTQKISQMYNNLEKLYHSLYILTNVQFMSLNDELG